MPFVLDSAIEAQIACIAMNDVAQVLYGEGHINIDVEDVQAILHPHQSSGLFTSVISVLSSIDDIFREIERVFASPVFSSNQKLGILCFCTLSPSIARKSYIHSALASVRQRISRESEFFSTFREDWNLGNAIRITVLVSSERQWC
jgi:cell division GTPase FtsZ